MAERWLAWLEQLARAAGVPCPSTWPIRSTSDVVALGRELPSPCALALITTLQATSPYWASGLLPLIVGIGSGLFNSPNTAAMTGRCRPSGAASPRERGRCFRTPAR
jgi:hypothetical protein